MIIVNDKYNCCGCCACGDICPKQAISFKNDEEGFWYPQVDRTKCVNCNLCEKVCPFLKEKDTSKPLDCFAAFNKNEEERKNSSSGGIFALLMNHVLDEQGVIFGAVLDKNWMVCHTHVDNYEDAKLLRGSKYVQSYLEGNYKQVQEYLKQGRKVLFSGTSCQVAALKNFLGKEYDNLITVDVVCHGVPSPGVWKEYLKYLRRPEGAVKGKNTVLSSLNDTPSIEGISFRDKANGWKKYGFVVRYSTDHREVEKFGLSSLNTNFVWESHDDNVYMQGFLNNFYLRPSCYRCRVKAGRCGSDLTLGDFWGIEDVMPHIDDDKGVSLVLANSKKGEDIIRIINPVLYEIPYDCGLRGNPCIEHSVVETKWRTLFMKRFCKTHDINEVKKIIRRMKPSLFDRIFRKIKNFLLSKK